MTKLCGFLKENDCLWIYFQKNDQRDLGCWYVVGVRGSESMSDWREKGSHVSSPNFITFSQKKCVRQREKQMISIKIWSRKSCHQLLEFLKLYEYYPNPETVVFICALGIFFLALWKRKIFYLIVSKCRPICLVRNTHIYIHIHTSRIELLVLLCWVTNVI